MVELNTGRVTHPLFWTRVGFNHAPKGVSTPNREEMRARDLTDRQQEVLDHIREHIRKWGMPPSRAELAKSVGLAFGSGVLYHLQALERKGWIELTPGRTGASDCCERGLRVRPDELPEVAAGAPILADESKAIMRVPDELTRRLHPQADFYVVVRGDSMSSVGYQSGDIVAVKRTPDPADGDIVVARIGTDITLKCFHRPSDDRVELRPCSKNPEHCTIVIDEQTEDWEIVGVVVGAMIGPPR